MLARGLVSIGPLGKQIVTEKRCAIDLPFRRHNDILVTEFRLKHSGSQSSFGSNWGDA